MNHKVNLFSFIERDRAKCVFCRRRIRQGQGDVLLRDLSGKTRPRFYHLGAPCETAAQRLIDANPNRWRGARRHIPEAAAVPTRGGGHPLIGQCSGITRSGGRCTRSAEGPNGLCWLHDPTRSEERRRAASKAGRAKPSREIAGVKALLSSLTDQVLDGKLDKGAAAVANQLINTRLRAVELERKIKETQELEERIELLEEAAQEAPGQKETQRIKKWR